MPTSITPAAPKDLSLSLSTLDLSLTSTLNLVIQASTLTILDSPPNASKTAGAFSTISLFPDAILDLLAAACPLAAWKSALV